MLRLKKNKTDLSTERGSIPIGIPISCLNTIFPIVKQHFLIRKIKYLLSIIKYLLPRPVEVQYIEDADYPILLLTFDLKTKCIISGRPLINYGVYIVVCKVLKP